MSDVLITDIFKFPSRTGDYFFISRYNKQAKDDLAIMFPSPYWGLFFYHNLVIRNNKTEVLEGFRPLTGDYIFIFFTNIVLMKKGDGRFRPRIGDYFLSYKRYDRRRKGGICVSVPILGIIFYPYPL